MMKSTILFSLLMISLLRASDSNDLAKERFEKFIYDDCLDTNLVDIKGPRLKRVCKCIAGGFTNSILKNVKHEDTEKVLNMAKYIMETDDKSYAIRQKAIGYNYFISMGLCTQLIP